MAEEDSRSIEKRRAQGCLNWAVGGFTGSAIIIVYFSSQVDLFTGEQTSSRSIYLTSNAKLTLERLIKECAVKAIELGLAHHSNGPTHADINTANEELRGYIITHSINASKLEPRSSCYSVAAIPQDGPLFSYQIIYSRGTGDRLKTCLPVIKESRSGCKDGTWE